MGSQVHARVLEQRRVLAVTRVSEGYRQKDVAAFLGVHPRTVYAWVRAARLAGGLGGLRAKPKSGRPRKLSRRQERTVLGWVARRPTSFGFANDLWTTRRLAALIKERWSVRFNANYLAAWLQARGHSPQRPEQPAIERNEEAVARWVAEDWPRLQKKPEKRGLTSCSSTRAAFCSIRWCVARGHGGARRRCGEAGAATATRSR